MKNTALAADLQKPHDALVATDRATLWHPFTQHSEWESYDPIVVERAEGFHLYDGEGRAYLDGVSSLWCNVHGHCHPHLTRALHEQADRVAHSTMLGLSHRPAIELAERLVAITPEPLTRVFYSDSGSTAVEVALRMAFQYQRQTGRPERTRFVTLEGAYHGDTLGSVSLGFSEPFHSGYEPITFRTLKFDPPFLHDATDLEAGSRASLAQLEALLEHDGETVAAVFMEPLVQGAAGIWPQTPSFVRGVRELCDRFGCLLVCDEVATGFARTGTMFAVEQAGVSPDIMCLAKGLTGGYLPLAATLATEPIFAAFQAPYAQYKTLFHGHTYGGNPLGCAVALASLEVFEMENTVTEAARRGEAFGRMLCEHIEPSAHTGPVRRVGLMCGFDIVDDGRRPYPAEQRRAHRAALAARERGVIIRPLGDTMVLMPAPAMPEHLLEQLVRTTAEAVAEAVRA